MSSSQPSRQSRYYLRHRDALREKLGGKCSICGSTLDLEFDHPDGRLYEARRLSSHRRIAQYERDAAAGNLRLLCAECNGKDGGERGGRVRREIGKFGTGGFDFGGKKEEVEGDGQ